jgi:hypothetical protein
MIMVQKSFNVFAFVFFVPLVFIGAFFLLNLTLAVIKSKFTEKHNLTKHKFVNKTESTEEIERKMEADKSRINRKIKPHVKEKLFSILKKVRDKLDGNEGDGNSKNLLKRPISMAGALRRNMFDDEDDADFYTKHERTKIEGNPELVQQYKKLKRKKSIKFNNGQGVMDEESSGSFNPSSDSESSKNKVHEESKSKDEDSSEQPESSPEENQIVINKISPTKTPNKTNSKQSLYSNTNGTGKNKWRNKLNISRETIYEVDEEHRSDTTHRLSKFEIIICVGLGINKLMGSSDHVSSTRKFNKVLSTLKGNSANSSMVAANKVMSSSSNPYYEQNDSPLIDPSGASGNLLNIKSNSRKKKNSSRNFMEKLEENMDLELNSDRLG